jgi:hypothetical protein
MKFFAATRFGSAKRLVAPKNFGDPESRNREVLRGNKRLACERGCVPRRTSGILKFGTAKFFAAKRSDTPKGCIA